MGESSVTGEDSKAGTDAAAPVPMAGETALQRQVDAIAAERGLARGQVTAGQQLANMPAVTPTAFAAVAGILDILIDADARAGTEEEDGT